MSALPKNIKLAVKKYAIVLTCILTLSFLASCGARFHWLLDLFSHFAFQYIIGGLFLGTILLAFKKWKIATLALVVAFLCLMENRLVLSDPMPFSSEADRSQLTIVQFNLNVANNRLDDISNWLDENAGHFDVVVLQEATPRLLTVVNNLKTAYPHQIQEPRPDAFGMIILSRHPILETEKIHLDGPLYKSLFIRLVVHPPGMKKAVTIFALHTLPPMNNRYKKQRDFELQESAGIIAAYQGTSPHTIFMGDWNITPYAPIFKDVLKITGLNYQSYGLALQPTWPAQFKLPLFQIPIDQVLSSSSLQQTNKKTGNSFGSDHRAVIVNFIEHRD